ncbi:hypothetical protein G7Y79_00005g016100 [Physcia stellaris]|nr:hypothetical protein G7Y79_00005g016100 [Physcia stellaris]
MALETDILKYQYQPLEEGFAFRLLVLEIGQEKEDIRCSLKHTSLEYPDIQYVALSYTWGDQNDRRLISVDGCSVSITANLYSALYRLRKPIENIMIWADAICIDQSNRNERERQVGMMDQIYRLAAHVVADLGEEDEQSKLAFQLASDIIGVVRELEDDVVIKEPEFESYGLPNWQDKAWPAWTNFLQRPWFRRVWVIQEFALAKEVKMLCGKTFFPWQALEYTISMMNHHGFGENQRSIRDQSYAGILKASRSTVNIMSMTILRRQVEANQKMTLSELLAFTRICEATDPRDKVYAFLGLATITAGQELYISYTQSTSVVYQRYASWQINHGMAMEMLYRAGGPSSLTGLPSWCPDWSRRRPDSYLGRLYFPDGRTKIYRCSGIHEPEIHLDARQSTVSVSGVVVDYITEVGSPMFWDESRPLSDNDIWERSLEWEAETQRLKVKLQNYPTGEAVDEAYWRTLIGNKTHTDGALPGDFAKSHAAHLETQKAYRQGSSVSNGSGNLPFSRTLASTAASTTFEELENLARPFRLGTQVMFWRRRFCITKKGYMGMVPMNAAEGHLISIFLGGSAPFVLKPEVREPQHIARVYYQLVGECYLHGIMNGEFFQGLTIDKKTFEIQ